MVGEEGAGRGELADRQFACCCYQSLSQTSKQLHSNISWVLQEQRQQQHAKDTDTDADTNVIVNL